MEKIIFLDVDGVLNHVDCWNDNGKNPHPAEIVKGGEGVLKISIECVKQLNRIIKETGAKIVLSSTWRRHKNHYDFLLTANIKGEFIGETPDLLYDLSRETYRGTEIKEWLNEFGEDCKFIILDDDDDMEDLMDHLIQTDYMANGLTEEIANEAIKKLNEGE